MVKTLAIFDHAHMPASVEQPASAAEVVIVWGGMRVLWRNAGDELRSAALAALRLMYPRMFPGELLAICEGGAAVISGGCTVQLPPSDDFGAVGVVPYNPPASCPADWWGVGGCTVQPPPVDHVGMPSGLTSEEAMHWGTVTELARHDLGELATVFDLPNSALCAAAEDAAQRVCRLVAFWARAGISAVTVGELLRAFAASRSVALDDDQTVAQWAARMSNPVWWRRAMRRRFRAVEQAAIEAGQVQRHASPYASPRALERSQLAAQRLAQMLEDYEMHNPETGDVLPLADLVEASLSNPSNRRKALCARIAGVEKFATEAGMVATFATLTAPSRFHPFTHDGKPNPRYSGTSPRDAQAWLGKTWANAMRKLKRRGLLPMGVRVTEPHHDATPHWHAVIWCSAPALERLPRDHNLRILEATLRDYALADDGDEPGAAERRCTFQRIDPAKGSALGYVIKYVSKSVDGYGVDGDIETGQSAADASRGVVVWSRVWGVRQFQFFGLPPITPTRELFRIDDTATLSPDLLGLHAAAKANDYAGWLKELERAECGGGVVVKSGYAVKPSARYEGELSRKLEGVDVEPAGSGAWGRRLACDPKPAGGCTVQPPPAEVSAVADVLAASSLTLDEMRAALARITQLGTRIITRSGTWTIRRRAGAEPGAAVSAVSPPRTRFNNSAQPSHYPEGVT